MPFSRIFIRKIFCKSLSKYLWQSLFLAKSHAFRIFFWTPLDGCVCVMKIKMHLIFGLKTAFRLQKPHCKNFWWKHIKNEGCKCYLDSKEQKGMFLVVSRSGVHFGFEHPFFTCPIRRASKMAREKIRAFRKKSDHTWRYFSTWGFVFHRSIHFFWILDSHVIMTSW